MWTKFNLLKSPNTPTTRLKPKSLYRNIKQSLAWELGGGLRTWLTSSLFKPIYQ